MLWQSDLLFVACGFLVIFFLCKWINQQWKLQKRYKQFIAYFSNVIHNSKKNADAVQDSPLLTHLNNYSQKMQSWYEQASTDTATDNNGSSSSSGEDEDEESDSGENNHKNYKNKALLSKKPVICSSNNYHSRSVGIQTNLHNGGGRGSTERHLQNSSWRTNQFYYSSGNNAGHEKSCDLQSIRRIQEEQLKTLLKQVRYFGEKDLRAPLIICVEANATNISGYMINLKTRVCKFYVFGIRHLPWKLETSPGDWDSTEFKMKNVLFALLLWEEEILRSKKFSIFANCWALNHPDCSFGRMATDLLEHFTSCENVIRVNSNSQVSRFRDTGVFAKLIQPARELMCWNLSRFRHYIKNAYGILEFDGSHSFLDNFRSSAKDDGYYAKSYRYDYFLTKVNKNAEKWGKKACRKCDLQFSNRMDLKTCSNLGLSDDSEEGESDPGIMPYPLTDNNW